MGLALRNSKEANFLLDVKISFNTQITLWVGKHKISNQGESPWTGEMNFIFNHLFEVEKQAEIEVVTSLDLAQFIIGFQLGEDSVIFE